MILVECGGVEAEMFPNLQEVASVELGLETIPVSSPDHAAKYLTQMVNIKYSTVHVHNYLACCKGEECMCESSWVWWSSTSTRGPGPVANSPVSTENWSS